MNRWATAGSDSMTIRFSQLTTPFEWCLRVCVSVCVKDAKLELCRRL